MVRRKSEALTVHKDDPAGASLDAKLYRDTIPDASRHTLSDEGNGPEDMRPPKRRKRDQKSHPISALVGAGKEHLEDPSVAAVGPAAGNPKSTSSAAAVGLERGRAGALITAPAGPGRKRVVLKEKTPNPSSSDIHSIDLQEPFPKKRKQKQSAKRIDLTDDAVAATPRSGLAVHKGTSLLQESFAVGGPVYRALKNLLPPKDFDALVELVEEDAAQGVADLVTKKSCWSPELLDSFRGSELRSLDLSSPSSSSSEVFITDKPPALTLRSLYRQDQFAALATLSLRNTPLSNNDLGFLMLLPSLADLDIQNTGLGTHSLHHIVCHHRTLLTLNVSHNPAMDDDCRVALSALPLLGSLYLRGTNMSMPGLRRLVTKGLPYSCRLLSIPAHCIEFLNNRKSYYLVDIPDFYVRDPEILQNLSIPELKRNLELHARVNKDVHLTGTKNELFHRLNSILQNRLADARIIKVLGRLEQV